MTTAPLRSLASAARRLAGRVLHRRPEPPDESFPIHDLRVLNPLLERHGVPPLTADPAQAEAGIPGAARFVLGLLASSPALREKFPTALGSGPDGAFCQWLTSEPNPAKLTGPGRRNVAAAFAADPGERVRRVYEFRPDMRSVFPFGLTPQQRGEYLVWLLTHGAAEMGVAAEEALWFLFTEDEAPDRGLVRTFRLNPDWQARVPHGLTTFGWGDLLTYLREVGLRGRWCERLPTPRVYGPWDELTLLRRARPELDATFPRSGDAAAVLAWLDAQPGLPKPDAGWRAELTREFAGGLPKRPGVNYVGHFRYPSGLQQATLSAVRALERVGARTSLRDMLPEFPGDLADRTRYDGVELFDATVVCTGINVPPAAYLARSGMHLRPGVFRAAVWYWEADEPPEDLAEMAAPFDEVWAPTRYLADAFRKRLTTTPVVPMLPGLELPPFERRPKSAFGLRDERVTFLVTFDMASLMARKNPLAAVAAFRLAFRRDEPAELVVKVSRGAESPAELAALGEACAADGVTLIDRLMTRGELLTLMAAADCYVSLHRSEGLGLGPAESMLLGKPVVATGYSGNTDFMTPDTGYLVDFTLVPIPDGATPYPKGSRWAEPSVEHAAELMRRVFDRPDEANGLGARAKAHLAELMSPEAFGQRMLARLKAVGRG